jgi:hypothetical protein
MAVRGGEKELFFAAPRIAVDAAPKVGGGTLRLTVA